MHREDVTYLAIRRLTNEEIDRDKLYIPYTNRSTWTINNAKTNGIECILVERWRPQPDFISEITYHDTEEVSCYLVINILVADNPRELGPQRFKFFGTDEYTVYNTLDQAFEAFWLGQKKDRFVVV